MAMLLSIWIASLGEAVMRYLGILVLAGAAALLAGCVDGDDYRGSGPGYQGRTVYRDDAPRYRPPRYEPPREEWRDRRDNDYVSRRDNRPRKDWDDGNRRPDRDRQDWRDRRYGQRGY